MLKLVVCRLVKCKDVTNARVTADALEAKLPYLLQFLASSDDDVSGTIAPFANEYVALLKQNLPVDNCQKQFIKVTRSYFILFSSSSCKQFFCSIF